MPDSITLLDGVVEDDISGGTDRVLCGLVVIWIPYLNAPADGAKGPEYIGGHR